MLDIVIPKLNYHRSKWKQSNTNVPLESIKDGKKVSWEIIVMSTADGQMEDKEGGKKLFALRLQSNQSVSHYRKLAQTNLVWKIFRSLRTSPKRSPPET